MIEYYIYFVFLWLFAFLEYLTKKNIFLISILFFFIFLALRVDTGYDWPVYKNVFYAIDSLDNSINLTSIATIYNQELGFVYFLSLLKNISNDFQIVIFIVSIIETYSLYIFLQTTSKSPSIVLAVVGTWLLFTLYFSVLRQGLAVSFFFLFMIYMHKQFYIRAIIMFLLSISMQVSSGMYYILYLFSSLKIKKEYLLLFFVLSLFLGYFSHTISIFFFSVIQSLGIPVLSGKMSWYMQERITHVSTFDRIFVYFYSTTMFIFLYQTWDSYKSKLMIRLSFFALIYIFIQLIFVDYPLIRNRLQYVSFIIQFILLFNYFYYKELHIRFMIMVTILTLVLSYYTLILTRGSAAVYLPYQDYIRYGLFDNISSGSQRQDKMFEIKNK